jgi:hypothetical protein
MFYVEMYLGKINGEGADFFDFPVGSVPSGADAIGFGMRIALDNYPSTAEINAAAQRVIEASALRHDMAATLKELDTLKGLLTAETPKS